MKGLMPATTTATELQRKYKKVLKRARRTKEPVVVLSNNKPEGVYLDYETFRLKYMKQDTVGKKKARKRKTLDELFGTWTKQEAEEFNKVIDEMFEQVDPEAWK